ncbi:hypothetical protein GCM10022221_13160 [Actinocorallia aurea]
MLRRTGYLLAVLVLLLFVLRHPTGAAETALAIGRALAGLADAVAVFTRAL